jgi:CheY-like chemotaxis protein
MNQKFSPDEFNSIYLQLINKNKCCLACNSPDLKSGYEYHKSKLLKKIVCSKCGWNFTFFPSQPKDKQPILCNDQFPIIFLLVEDNPDDLGYIFRDLNKSQLNIFLQWLETGEEAMDYLQGIGPYKNRKSYPLPDVIISDNNLPSLSGIELLEWVKQQENFKHIPFLIMSHSSLEIDVKQATQLGATYYTKSTSIDDYISILKNLCALVTNGFSTI